MILIEEMLGTRRGVVVESAMMRIWEVIGESRTWLGFVDRKSRDVVCIHPVSQSQLEDIKAAVDQKFGEPVGEVLEASTLQEDK